MRPWFHAGLEFSCTRCGSCCTGEPGHVWLAPEDERSIAARLGLPLARFRAEYTRVVGDRRSLLERAGGDCVLLSEDRRCTVHAVKPRQCLVYPFWPRLVASPEAWAAEGRTCPGMGAGALHTAEEVARLADPATPRAELEAIVEGKTA